MRGAFFQIFPFQTWPQMDRLSPKIHPSLTEDILEALFSKHIFTVLDFVKADTKKIIDATRITFAEALAIKKTLLKDFSAPPLNGLDYYKFTLSNTAIIPTGNESIDGLLNGGLFTGNIYEICGPPASGKTHLVLSLVKNVILKMQQNVRFFDTKNDFSAQKMKNMLSGCDEKLQMECLSRIMVTRTHSKSDLINGLYELKNNLKSDRKLRLIIIDSLPAIILNCSDVTTNNSFLSHLNNVMRYVSVEHHVVFLVTNLITTWITSDFKNTPSPQNIEERETIACGKFWTSIPNTRLKIEKAEYQNQCKISVLHSDSFGEKTGTSANVFLTNEGFL